MCSTLPMNWFQLHQSIINMLKGQKYLIDEFNRFFKDAFPPTNNFNDFEETELLETTKGDEVDIYIIKS